MMLMKKYVLLLCALLMSMSLLTGCGGKKEGSNVFISADEDTSDIQSSEAVKGEEKQPLTIYHISDDEIELRFISKELTSVTNINFLAPSDDENGILNPAVGLKLEHTGNEIHPTMTVYNRTMDIEYTIDEYGGEQALEQMSISIDEDAFICSIRHENIIAAFEMVEMWVVDNDEPQSFNGVITEKVSAIVEPVVEGVLPEAFKCCEYDDQYFQPETDDYIVISYEQPVTLFIPVWYKNRTGIYEYGPYRDENTKNSSAKVTYILSFDNENCVNTKIRVEYKSVEEAMQAGLVYNFCICPVTLGYENEPNDELITEEYFEEAKLEDMPHLHIGFYPFPKEKIKKFLEPLKNIYIIEEGYPYLERYLRGIADTKFRLLKFTTIEATFWIGGKFRTCKYKKVHKK